jgi:formate dehydrogenase subunit gamma
MSILIVILIASGLVTWERYFAAFFSVTQERIAVLIHAAAAVIIIGVWIVHVYAAIWVRGTISAMTRGHVTGGWAWRHHRKWLRQLITGKPKERSTSKTAAE